MSAIEMAYIAALERRLERLERRTGSPFALSKLTMPADDSGVVQMMQVQLDPLSTRDGVPVLYHHGFFSSPPPGADLHVSFIDGNRSKAVIVATGHQTYRFKGAASGDAGLFAQGQLIHLNSGEITIKGPIGHTGNYTLTGNLTVTGAITATESIVAGQGGGDSVTLQHHTHDGGEPPTPGT